MQYNHNAVTVTNHSTGERNSRKTQIIPLNFKHVFTASFIRFLSCSKGIRRHWPLRSQRNTHHDHQTGSRASNFYWLVPGLGFQDVGHRPIGKNPCQILNLKPRALSLQICPLTCPALPFAILFFSSFSAKTNVITVQYIQLLEQECITCSKMFVNWQNWYSFFLHCPLSP